MTSASKSKKFRPSKSPSNAGHRPSSPASGARGRDVEKSRAEARIRAAARMFIACTRAKGPLDREVSTVLRESPGLDDDGRAFVVDTVYGMLRARRFLDAAAKHLPFEPTRDALVCLYLVAVKHADTSELPLNRAGVEVLAQAARSVGDVSLAVACSLPDWLVARFLAERGVDEGTRLCRALSEAAPMTLRTNTLRTNRDALLERLTAEGLVVNPTLRSPLGIVLERRANVFRTAAFQEGLFEVQDEGSQLIGLMAEAQPGSVVVDGCAGAGGKTLLLAGQMQNTGTLYAFDIARFRLEDLKVRARRADAHNIRVHSLEDDGPRRLARLEGKADVVLVDAPCSGTGVLRRNPDTSWKLEEADVARMVEQQGDILGRYAPLVKSGGRLVYATCSLLSDENEKQVASFLAQHPEFSLLPASEILPRAGVPPQGATDVLRTGPHMDGADGFFAAALVRR
jgi:16S rRNA (cytosine967-C5)-methyltransferase